MIFYAVSDRKQERSGNLSLQLDKYLRLGADWIQIREKDLEDNELFEASKAAVLKAKTAGTRIFVNGRADIAALSGASGVHLPADSLFASKIRAAFPGLLIIKSCHTKEDVKNAEESGADFVTISPIFPTPSKMDILEPIGIHALKQICSSSKIPIIALGGIGREQVGPVIEAGAYGIAGIRLFNDWKDGGENLLSDLKETLGRLP